jgi:hypothetical protein
MKLIAIHEYTLEPASKVTCLQFRRPVGTLELLDSESDRVAFCTDLNDAKKIIKDLNHPDDIIPA